MSRNRALWLGTVLSASVAVGWGSAVQTASDAPASQPQSDITTVYLVRHAEKASEQADELSPQGLARAKALAWVLRDVPLKGVYSTNFARTRETVRPTAEGKRLTVEKYDNPAALAGRIRTAHAGQCVLVVGHSNTLGETVSALGGSGVPPLINEYDNLFVVTIVHSGESTPQAHVQRLHYPSSVE